MELAAYGHLNRPVLNCTAVCASVFLTVKRIYIADDVSIQGSAKTSTLEVGIVRTASRFSGPGLVQGHLYFTDIRGTLILRISVNSIGSVIYGYP